MNAQNQAANNEETLDSLDETLDDLADAPSVAPFASGAHAVSLVVKRNPKKMSTYIVEMTHQETLELANPDDVAPNAGDKSSVFIHTKKKDGTANEMGQGQLKMVLSPIGAMLGTNSISEILEATSKGLDVIVVVSVRKSKDENYGDSQDIKSVQLPA